MLPLAAASSMRYSDIVPNVLQTVYLIFILERDTPLCVLLDYYSIKHVHITPGERLPGSATSIVPSLKERLHHFHTDSRWDLLLLLSDWVDVSGLKCPPWQITNIPPSSTEPGLHSSKHLLAADVMQSREEFRWD